MRLSADVTNGVLELMRKAKAHTRRLADGRVIQVRASQRRGRQSDDAPKPKRGRRRRRAEGEEGRGRGGSTGESKPRRRGRNRAEDDRPESPVARRERARGASSEPSEAEKWVLSFEAVRHTGVFPTMKRYVRAVEDIAVDEFGDKMRLSGKTRSARKLVAIYRERLGDGGFRQLLRLVQNETRRRRGYDGAD